MNILIIGGTGTISSYVVQKCVKEKMDVTVLNRGNNNQSIPKDVTIITGDINNEEEVRKLLKGKYYDTVVQFVAFTKEHVERDIRLFKNKTNQYIFISTASVYHKPVVDYPITEQTELINPFWDYSQHKIECEQYLQTVKEMNITIVRPSHTFDNRMVISAITRWTYDYAYIKRLLDGKPVIVPGDGTSLWTINHALDFANSFYYLIGNEQAYNEDFHITGNNLYTWDQLTIILAKALGVTPNIIHIPTEEIVKYIPELTGPLLGDKTWSTIFDNSKIKAISKEYTSSIRYEDVVDDVIQRYKENKELQRVSDEFEQLYDHLIDVYLKVVK